jgi:transposase
MEVTTMEEGQLRMSASERQRLIVYAQVAEGQLSLKQAALKLGVSYRQTRRMYQRWLSEGDGGLVHRARGRPSNRQTDPPLRSQVLACYEEHYRHVSPTIAADMMSAHDGLKINRHTLRAWLIEDGLWQARKRRAPAHKRRQRKAHFGELVQMDGSFHHWFGAEHPRACLMNMVDDATGITLSLLAPEETTEAAMRLLWMWIERYGVPRCLYVDRKNVYVLKQEATVEQQLEGVEPATHFGLACRKLGIGIIQAHSPQAKGRVERSNGTYQGRLVIELQRRGITTIDEANAVLPAFCQRLNDKNAVPPADTEDHHRLAPEGLNLTTVFCWEEKRKLTNDHVVRYDNRYFQVLKQPARPRPGTAITLQKWLDGSIHLWIKDAQLVYEEITADQLKARREQARAHPQDQTAAAKETGSSNRTREPYRLHKSSAQQQRDFERHRKDGWALLNKQAAELTASAEILDSNNRADTEGFDAELDISHYL